MRASSLVQLSVLLDEAPNVGRIGECRWFDVRFDESQITLIAERTPLSRSGEFGTLKASDCKPILI